MKIRAGSKRLLALSLVFLFLWSFHGIGEAASSSALKPSAQLSIKNDVSKPLRDINTKRPAIPTKIREIPLLRPPKGDGTSALSVDRSDAALQNFFGESSMPESTSFEGVNNIYGYLPPDTCGDVGPNHYIQWVNVSFAIYDKEGATLYGPTDGNTLWDGFGGPCETSNDGDPIVLYDQQADRWLMSQFAIPNDNGPFYQCIAVSQSGDPLGEWRRYSYEFEKMNDYPKFGVWPDGYYMTINQFSAGDFDWAGAGVAAFEREKMLAGLPARMIYFDLESTDSAFAGMLPSDWDGVSPPPEGSPNYFAEVDDGAWIGGEDALRIWEFHADWTTTSNSTFGIANQPNAVLPVAEWTPLCMGSRNCVAQPDTAVKLDAIGDRLMFRLQYRNFGTHESLVANHTVDGGGGQAGIRWYEIRDPGGAPSIHQQGTWAPDSASRWMGSIAMDHQGNMALGYSVSSSSIYPSIRYTGRLVGDTPGEMSQGETVLIAGGGSQLHSAARWGDYSSMSVDPVDDCTFWYTQEYYETTSQAGWRTRIGYFKFPGCTQEVTGVLRGKVTNEEGDPISGAKVSTLKASTTTDANGEYQLAFHPVGSYDVTASAYGYQSSIVNKVSVNEGQTTTQDFSLTPLPLIQVCGTVRDGSGQGWALYARIDIYADTTALDPIYTDPLTGAYCVDLIEGMNYTFAITPLGGGYATFQQTRQAQAAIDFQIPVDQETCSAPGYAFAINKSEDFEDDDGAYTVSGTTSWAWGVPTSGPQSAHSGDKCWGANLNGEYNNDEDGYITSPAMDLTQFAGQSFNLVWWQWLQSEGGYDFASVEVSKDGGSTWKTVYGAVSGNVDLTWTQHSVLLDSSYAVSDFHVRFRLTSDEMETGAGYFIDDVSVGLCAALSGGMLVGNIYDANTDETLNGALISNGAGNSTKSGPTTGDANVADGYYALFLPSGPNSLTVAGPGIGYGQQALDLDMTSDSVTRRDFKLQAGKLSIDPELTVTLELGQTKTATLTLQNSGGLPASFEMKEVFNSPYPLGPFQQPAFVVKPFKANRKISKGLGLISQPTAPAYAIGDIVQTWPSGLSDPWGLGFNLMEGDLWIGNVASSSGDERAYRFLLDGANTGMTFDLSWADSFAADMTYNANTNTLWVMDVGDYNCIHEIDPLTQTVTGEKICPSWSTSQRGLAYDPVTDTYFAGGWNDQMLYRFAADGTILAQVNAGLDTAGLAYNPDTGHLFIMTNDAPNPVYVLDVAADYAIIGSFTIPGFSDYGGAGLEMDCDGRLWALDQSTGTVYQIDSGEDSSCAADIAWLAEDPSNGVVDANSAQAVTVTFNAAVPEIAQTGQYTALLKIKEDTPYKLAYVQATMVVTDPTYSISGAVKDNQGVPLSGVTVTLKGSASQIATTGADGAYAFSGLANGAYIITPSNDQYIFDPLELSLDISGANLTGQDFIGTIMTGALVVSITPNEAVTAGAQWRFAGEGDDSWRDPGTVSDIPVGAKTVEFKAISGWTTPDSVEVAIFADTQASASGAYVQLKGSLTVAITPAEAVTAGAQWKFTDEDAWRDPGTVSDIPVGAKTVEFKTISGWTTPEDVPVTISADAPASASGEYVQLTGALTVSITPNEAVTAGAQWRFAGEDTWRNPGTVSDIPVGAKTVEFKAISGWTTPANVPATISADTPATASGAYVQLKGALTVAIASSGAVRKGARWSIDSGVTWRESGATAGNLDPGEYSLKLKDIEGWTRPASQTVTILAGEAKEVTVSYIADITITATDPYASESKDNGLFTITRSTDASKKLVVSYTVSGSAENGKDYKKLKGKVTIKKNASTATITVKPKNDKLAEDVEDVTLSLSNGERATVTIEDND